MSTDNGEEALDLAEALETLLSALSKQGSRMSLEVHDAYIQANNTLDEYQAVHLG